MRFYEVDSSVDAIMSAAMVAQTRASNTGKQGKLSMNGFLQMLANAGIMMDYDGFKTVFDTNPQLKNVIAQFNKDEITFVGDSDDESVGYEEPQGDMPNDERVAKMAQRATKMRTREFVEGELPPHLSKMFGKDGSQVDTRTDVMKQMRDIVDNKSAMEVEFGDGKQMVDMFTASTLIQVYDKVNDKNKEAIVQRVGTIEKFMKLMPKLFGMIGSTKVSESLYDAYAIIDDNDKIVSVHSTSKEAQAEAVKVNGAVVPMPKGKGVGDIVEGSSPHKKGTEKYRKHMAAMHANMEQKQESKMNEAWQVFKEGIKKGKPATGKDKIDKISHYQVHLLQRIAKHVEDGLTRREVVAAYPNHDPNDIAKLYDNEKALQDFEAGAKEMFPKAKDEAPSKKLSLTTPITMEPLDLSKLDPNRVSLRSVRKK